MIRHNTCRKTEREKEVRTKGRVRLNVKRKKGGRVGGQEVENKAELESDRMRGEENHIRKSIRHLFIIPGRAPM